MRRLRRIAVIGSLAAVASLAPLAGSAFATGKHGPPPPTIVDLAVSSPDLSILVAAVKRAGLVETLASPGRYTVFAPTNAAFAKLLADLKLTSLDQVPPDTLKAILLDHVLARPVFSWGLDLWDRVDATPATIGGLQLDTDRSPLQVNNANVVATDLRASNGVVHVIDAVLLDPDPRPSIVELALGNKDLSILAAAVQKAGFVDFLNTNERLLTVFAPTNDAFVRLLGQLGLKSLDDVPVHTLRAILRDHVLRYEYDAVDVGEVIAIGGALRTYGGLELRFGAKPLTVNGIPILATDVEGRNGTVHVIDGVLLDSVDK